MSCLVGGNLSFCICSWLDFPHFLYNNCFQTAYSQHCTKVAYHRSWFTNNPLVPVTLRSFAANLCDGRTRSNWATPHDCPQCSKLYNISHIIRSVLSVFFIMFLDFFSGLLTRNGFPLQLKCGAPVLNKGV